MIESRPKIVINIFEFFLRLKLQVNHYPSQGWLTVSATVLIIDNDVSLFEQLEPILLQEGYRVIPTFTGKDGIECARKENPDVVLLRLKLPDMDGLQVFKSIDKLEPRPITIITTMGGDIEVAVSAMKMGGF